MLKRMVVAAAAIAVTTVLTAPDADASTSLLTQVKTCAHNGVIVKWGSTGSCVKSEQTFLNDYRTSWGGSKLTVDGVDGHATTAQIRVFQKWTAIYGNRLPVDGIVGPATWSWEEDCIETANTSTAPCTGSS